ncbi:MAG TPA: inositol monophosphatase family protein [Candidatus Dormibacteraeota bacterium]
MLRELGLPQPGGPAFEKHPGDWVTAADLASEHAILEVLARRASGIPVLAEETGGARAATMWAVDPLDGTRNYTRGLPVVGVSVALIEDGLPAAGVVLAPWLDLEFTAERARGARRNGQPLPIAPLTDPPAAVIATGFPFRRKQRAGRYLSVFAGALARFEDLRRAGAAALDLAWTGAGVFDGFFELGLNTWDMAAGALVVTETGGRVTDWQGDERAWLQGGDVLAGSPAVHSALLELAAQAPEG